MRIILTLEQFPIFYAGAYGNKIEKTPGLDTWTLKSTVFDRAYSTCADGLETLFQLWETCDFSTERFSGRKVFISDLPVDAPEFFDAGKTVSSEEFFADTDAVLAEMKADFVWVHFQSCSLEMLDTWLLKPGVTEVLWALLGTSGELPDGDVRLYSSEIQLPWWIRFPDAHYAGTRCHALVTVADFQKILDAGTPDAHFRDGIRIQTEDARWAVVTENWFLTGFEPSEEENEGDNENVTDAEPSDEPELYFKPSDWWDQNDVAVRCFNEIQELLRFRDGVTDLPFGE